jgi:hypothetical protein
MTMPSGSSPQEAEAYFRYLNAQHLSDGRVGTWHVDWVSIAWIWGFVAALCLVLLLWIRQYRTTRGLPGLYPVATFGGWTSERATPATRFFFVLSAIVTAFAVVLIVGHLVDGQVY